MTGYASPARASTVLRGSEAPSRIVCHGGEPAQLQRGKKYSEREHTVLERLELVQVCAADGPVPRGPGSRPPPGRRHGAASPLSDRHWHDGDGPAVTVTAIGLRVRWKLKYLPGRRRRAVPVTLSARLRVASRYQCQGHRDCSYRDGPGPVAGPTRTSEVQVRRVVSVTVVTNTVARSRRLQAAGWEPENC